ncbi:ABC transporter [Colletotrichum gloeosporioides Cg-14]|uniref:homocitrate synthase n=1 Tax=Colletotrichum gloeosporioides (strain Cg-14) TaxID=1237896 RepID=T0JZ75_COLGC|nr:ABC transporter [Colletotrichum gloeosporioides Cg-14]
MSAAAHRNEAMTYTQFYRQIQERATQYHVPGPFKDFGKGPELGKCGIDDPWTCVYSHAVYQLTTTLRGGLVSIIFRKSLGLDATIASQAKAVTLMSTDIDAIASGVKDLHEIWASVLELGIAVYLLNLQIGAACFVVIIPAVVCSFITERATDGIGPARMMWNKGVQERVSTTSSMLAQIKGIKMMGLTDYFATMVQKLRVAELDMSKKFRMFIVRIILISNLSDQMTPAVVVTAAVFWTRADGFTISQAFTSLAIVALVSTPLANLIGSYPTFASSVACFGRIQEFLVQEERRPEQVQDTEAAERKATVSTASIPNTTSHTTSKHRVIEMKEMRSRQPSEKSDVAISLENVTVGVEGKDEPILRDIMLSIPRAKYTEVTGVVGCGKSTLLKTILGELALISGSIRFAQPNMSVAFCEQSAWLRNISIKDNIVGQQRFDDEWYGRVVFACDLRQDIARLPKGDDTLVGSGGINLSGGQKQRVALARAVFARRSIVLLDDPFSALDAETRTKVFSRLLGEEGLLRKGDTTVIHTTPAGPRKKIADNVILLSKTGSVEQAGPSISIATAFKDVDVQPQPDDSIQQDEDVSAAAKTPETKDEDATQRQSGDFSLYKFYLRSIGPTLTIAFILAAATYIFLGFMPNIWLRIWIERGTNDGSRDAYFGAYLAFCIGTVLFSGLAIGLFFVVVIPHSASRLHWQLLDSVLKAPLWFFTTVDSGVTLNRFSQDMTLVDQTLPTAFFEVVLDTLVAIASVALIASGAQYFAAIIPFSVLPLYFLQKFYLKTSRQMRHLDLESKSPLYTHFTETLNGVVTIRAFGWQQEFVKEQLRLLDISQRPYYLLFCIQRWLAVMLDLFVAVIATVLVAFAVKLTNTTSGGAIGLSMVSLMGLNSSLSRLISSWTNLETSLGAIARLRDFVRDSPQEDGVDAQRLPPVPQGWPSSGAIEFKRIDARYKTDDENVLRELSLSIKPGQKVGICGRTGSGKTSLLLTLLRLLETPSGSIQVDNVDLCSLSRKAVRPHLITLPQDPVTLPGSVRTNLDPNASFNGESGDKALVEALEKTFLWDDVIKSRGGLDADFAELGLSHGQQQLFALARAILHKDQSMVVLLDEATSSVDHGTDKMLQKVLREELASHTILAVAHRLDTIEDYDVVVVMDNETKIKMQEPPIDTKLDDFGVDYIELTTPVASPQSRKDCELIYGLDLKAKILAHVRCHMDDVRAAVECGVDGVNIMMGTSALLRQHSHGKDVAQIIKAAIKVIEYVKSQGLEVRFSTEDFFRSNLVDILSVYKTVDKIGVNRVGVADTIGCANPRQVYDLIQTLRRVVSCDIETHFHDDTGCATANAYTALEAGATHIDVTVLGIGERNGITPLGGFMARLIVQNREYVTSKYKLHMIKELEDMVAEAVKINTPFNNPITGFCAFTHKSGYHAKGVLSHPSNYEIINPEDFGMTRYVHFESRLTGWHAVRTRVSQLGLEMPDDQVRIVQVQAE